MKKTNSKFNSQTEDDVEDAPVKIIPPAGNFIKSIVWVLMLPFALPARLFIGVPTFLFAFTGFVFGKIMNMSVKVGGLN